MFDVFIDVQCAQNDIRLNLSEGNEWCALYLGSDLDGQVYDSQRVQMVVLSGRQIHNFIFLLQVTDYRNRFKVCTDMIRSCSCIDHSQTLSE